MSKFILISILAIISVTVMTCAYLNSRVLKQTNTEAIIEGGGVSKAEARINAETIASSIFKDYEEYKEAEYTMTTKSSIDGEYRGGSWIICTIYIRKKM